MIAILLTILKIIGIVLLCIFLLLVTLLILVLFVPVRYQIRGYRKEEDEVPVRAAVKVSWLLHIINAAFRYPEEAYIKVRIFCFTVFSTRKEQETVSEEKEASARKRDQMKETRPQAEEKKAEGKKEEEKTAKEKIEEEKTEEADQDIPEKEPDEKAQIPEIEEQIKISGFLKKLFKILRNIKYTIRQIYDKIKHIIKNIRYYIRILKSDTFRRAWSLCSSEALGLLKTILPKKLTADFTIGTGDPAGTAQILSIEGILYPLVGDHISITPDFEHSIVEGTFFIKGKITLWRILLTAIKVYFNRDLRRVIRLFKKEAA